MAEHYTKSTVEATEWCSACHATTRHAVQSGRRGYCIPCQEKRTAAAATRPAKKPVPEQGSLFER